MKRTAFCSGSFCNGVSSVLGVFFGGILRSPKEKLLRKTGVMLTLLAVLGGFLIFPTLLQPTSAHAAEPTSTDGCNTCERGCFKELNPTGKASGSSDDCKVPADGEPPFDEYYIPLPPPGVKDFHYCVARYLFANNLTLRAYDFGLIKHWIGGEQLEIWRKVSITAGGGTYHLVYDNEMLLGYHHDGQEDWGCSVPPDIVGLADSVWDFGKYDSTPDVEYRAQPVVVRTLDAYDGDPSDYYYCNIQYYYDDPMDGKPDKLKELRATYLGVIKYSFRYRDGDGEGPLTRIYRGTPASYSAATFIDSDGSVRCVGPGTSANEGATIWETWSWGSQVGGTKMKMDADAVSRAKAAGLDRDDLTAEANFAIYASAKTEFYYDDGQNTNIPIGKDYYAGKVKSIATGNCCGGTGGLKETYEYSKMGEGLGDTDWYKKVTTDTRVDTDEDQSRTDEVGVVTVEYFNPDNRVVHKIVETHIDTDNTPDQSQHWHYEYDNGQLVREYTPESLDPSEIDFDEDETTALTATFENVSIKESDDTDLEGAWSDGDVGTLGGSASDSSETSGVHTIIGSGGGIADEEDAFYCRYNTITNNDIVFIAEIATPTSSDEGQAGIMIRDSSDDGAKHAFVGMDYEAGTIQLRYRSSADGETTTSSRFSGITAPCYVKLERDGTTFTAFQSSTGQSGSWQEIGSATIVMSDSVLVGLCSTIKQPASGNIALNNGAITNSGLIEITDRKSTSNDGDGLSGTYESDKTTEDSTRVLTYRIDEDFDGLNLASGLPDPIITKNLGVTWTGRIKPQYSEVYTITVLSDYGSRVDLTAANEANTSTGTSVSVTTDALTAGNVYYISITYTADATPGAITLKWSSLSSQSEQVIPTARLYSGAELEGNIVRESIKEGDDGDEIILAEYEYVLGIDEAADLLTKVTRYADYGAASEGVHATAAPEVTEYEYPDGFYVGNFQPKSRLTKVKLADTGGGVYLESKEWYDDSSDEEGRVIYSQDPNGAVTYYEYYTSGAGNGQIENEVQDASPGTPIGVDWDAHIEIPEELEDLPNRLNLVTSYTYNDDGDVDTVTHPDGTKTKYLTVEHTDCADFDSDGLPGTTNTFPRVQERRTYSLDSSNNLVGPVQITFAVEDGVTLSEQTGVATTVSTAAITNIQARTDYSYNTSGKMSHSRVYHDLSTPAYLETTYEYYDDGRTKYVERPGGLMTYYTSGPVEYATGKYGTQDRVYTCTKSGSTWTSIAPIGVTWSDSEGRTVRSWVGSRTATTEPSADETLTEESRVTYEYDWRNRSTKTKQYFNLASLTSLQEGTLGTNYYESEVLDYDNLGRGLWFKNVGGKTISTTTYDKAGNVTEQKTHAWASGDTLGDMLTKTENIYDDTTGFLEETKVYKVVSDTASAPVITEYYYDGLGRQENIVQHDNTYTELVYDKNSRVIRSKFYDDYTAQTPNLLSCQATVYDDAGRAVSQWVGTDDTGATAAAPGPGSGNNNMVKVSKTFYDTTWDGTGDERPYVTGVSRLKATDSTSSFNLTKFEYDGAGRQVGVIEPSPIGGSDVVYTQMTYDAAGRVTFVKKYTTNPTSGTLLSQSENVYTNANLTASRVYNGSSSNYLETLYDYDSAGRQCKVTQPTGAFTKTFYDDASQVTKQFVCSAEGTPDEADNVTGDTVVTQTNYAYDDTGQTWLTTTFNRNHNGTGDGELTTSNAQISYAVAWFDDLGRPTDQVFYGNNGGTAIDDKNDDFDPDTGSTQNYASGAPTADGSVNCIVTNYDYDGYGRVEEVTDNKGVVTQTTYDDMGRKTKVIENYVDGSVGNAEYDSDRTTEYTYNDFGQTTQIRAKSPNGTSVDNQDTVYTYGGDGTSESPVKRKDMLVKIAYPDSSGASDTVSFTYYANGAVKDKTDQRGVEHVYSYYDSGQLKADKIDDYPTTGEAGDAFDADAPLSITREYDDLGRVTKITSHGNATDDPTNTTDIDNQIVREYNGLGQLDTEYQEHDGAKDGSTKDLEYAYDDTVSSNKYTNGMRLKYITYPNGRKVWRGYDGHGGIDAALSRANKIADDNGSGAIGTSIAEYSFNGISQMVIKDYPTPDIKLDYSANSYDGFDRFGRIIKQQWIDYGPDPDIDMFNIKHGYDGNSNRLYADKQVYKGDSQYYTYDNLNRLTNFKAGKKTETGGVMDGVDSSWTRREQGWTLDAVGNQTAVDDYRRTPWRTATFNNANEYDDEDDALKTKAEYNQYKYSDSFGSSATESNFTVDDGGTFSITGGNLQIDTIGNDSKTAVLLGEDCGPVGPYIGVVFPTVSAGDYAGVIFGYKSSDDYWIYVSEATDSTHVRHRLYHVENGSKGSYLAESSEYSYTANTTNSLYFRSKRKSCFSGLTYEFPDGFPSGKIGLISNKAGAKFTHFYVPHPEPNNDLFGRWIDNTTVAQENGGAMRLTGSWASQYNPVLLKNVHLDKFKVDFKVKRSNYDPSSFRFIFNAKDQDYHNMVTICHKSTAYAPYLGKVADGGLYESVSSSRTTANVEARVNEDDWLYVRIICDPDDANDQYVKVYQATSFAGLDTKVSNTEPCMVSTDSSLKVDGGRIGFCASGGYIYIDDLTVYSWDSVASDWKTEVVEHFNATSDYGESPVIHDAAGNITYDGEHAYLFDAWNRMTKVNRACWDDEATAGEELQLGSVVATISYDGVNRRVVKKIENSADWDCTYEYYYDGNSMVETQNGSVKQNVWGTQYVDELLQIMIGAPWPEGSKPNHPFWAMQDANYNVLGVASRTGRLVERYEYTPYGQRTVYSHGWLSADVDDDGDVDDDDRDIMAGNYRLSPATLDEGDVNGSGHVSQTDVIAIFLLMGESVAFDDDPLVMYPAFESYRAGMNPYGLCDFGHQGRPHDKEFGLIYVNRRYLHPRLGRWMSTDPLDYIDGMNRFEYVGSNPVRYHDPDGLWKRVDKKGHTWCVEDGDTLESLASKKEYGGNADNWSCLWPTEDTKDYGYPKILALGDKYDASNLVVPSEPNKLWFTVDESLKNEGNAYNVTFFVQYGESVAEMLQSDSEEGATPITEMLIHGHSAAGEMAIGGTVQGETTDFLLGHLDKLNKKPTFARAKKKKGPLRCWFSRKSSARFSGCKTQSLAKVFAKGYLREGSISWGTQHNIGMTLSLGSRHYRLTHYSGAKGEKGRKVLGTTGRGAAIYSKTWKSYPGKL